MDEADFILPEQPKFIDLSQIATVEELIARRDGITARYNDFVGLLAERRSHLQEALRFGYWKKDGDDSKTFMEDKLIQAKAETTGSPKADQVALNDLESEVKGHRKSLDRLIACGNEMIEQGHFAGAEIKRTIDNLEDLWAQLLDQLAKKHGIIEHELKLEAWREKVQKVTVWINEKLPSAQSDNYGASLGEVSALKDSFDRLENEVKGFKPTIENLKTEADEIHLQDEYDTLNALWGALNEAIDKRREELSRAHTVQTYLEDCKTALAFLRQKNDFLSQSPIPDNVTDLEQVLRTHQRAHQELRCYEGKITALTDRCKTIDNEKCTETNLSIAEIWSEVNKDFDNHEEKIEAELNKQKFLVNSSKLLAWTNSMLEAIKSVNAPESASQADQIIEDHGQRKGEIETNREKIKNLVEQGNKIDQSVECEKLEASLAELDEAWAEKDALYQESLGHFRLLEDAQEKLDWLTDLDQSIENDLGKELDSLELTEQSATKLTNTQNLLNSQEKSIESLLTAENTFNPEKLQDAKEKTAEAKSKIVEKLTQRDNEIKTALKKHKFMAAADELNEIIDKKLESCASCDARDLTDMTQKVQSNQNLRSEIVAHKPKMDALAEMGMDVESQDIHKRLSDTQDKWDRLQTMVHEKGVELDEAATAMAFIRGREELESWLDEVEPQVQSKEYAKDLTSAKQLANQHQALTENIGNQAPSVQNLQDQLKTLFDSDNFMADELKTKTDAVVERYEKLKPPLDERDEKLKKAISDLSLLQDINEQLQNTSEQQTLLKSDFKPKDIVSAEAALLKNANLKSEIISNQAVIDKLKSDADECDNSDVKQAAEQLLNEREKLLASIEEKNAELNNKVQSFKYISDAAEASDYLAEKLKEAELDQIGSDEDEADALLKKHQTLCDDINAFKKRVNDLDEQRSQCTMQSIELEADKTDMKVIEPYHAQLKSEISVTEGDIVQLLSNPGGEWVKVQAGTVQGYIPAQCLAHCDDSRSEKEMIDLAEIQSKLANDYDQLHEKSESRKNALEKQNLKFELEREADDLKQWIKVQENALLKAQENGEDPEALRQKFEQFQKDQKQAEKLLDGLRDKAGAVGLKESASLQEMEDQWKSLENKAVDTESQIGGASRLKQFLGEAGQLGAWIQKKNQNIETPETLNQTKARIRRQQQLEGDMSAISERLDSLNGQKEKLVSDIPESEEQITSALNALNAEWANLQDQQAARKNMLNETLNYQEYAEEARVLENWLNNEEAVFDSFAVSNDLATIDAQKIQHDEHAKLITAKRAELASLNEKASTVVGHDEVVKARGEKLAKKFDQLDDQWKKVDGNIAEGDRLARFERDCERVEHWMNVREQSLNTNDDSDNVKLMIKKHEDFDRAIKLQESKMGSLVDDADKLAGDSAGDLVQKRKDEIMERWEQLKTDLTKKNKEVGEVQTLQEFWKQAEDYDEWLDEKIVIAEQPINEQHLNQGIQRHNAFLSEIRANQDRLESIVSAGNAIIEQNADQAHLIEEKTSSLKDKCAKLDELCLVKTKNYGNAELIRSFIGSCKALEFWLIETRSKIGEFDGKDWKTADNQLKSLILIKAEFHIKCELKDELKAKAEADNLQTTDQTIQKLETLFDEILVLMSKKQAELEAICVRFQLLSDLTEQVDWCKDKIILAKKEETGSDLAQAESYSTKHKRLSHEVDSKGVKIVGLIEKGIEMEEDEKAEELKTTWNELNNAMDTRRAAINATLDELNFQSAVTEEIAWTTEKTRLLGNTEVEDNLDAIRDQLQKLDALKIDMDAHKTRAQKLEENSPTDSNVMLLKERINDLELKFSDVKKQLDQKEAFLQYKRRCQNNLDWIADRQQRIENENMANNDLAKIISSFTKQDQMEDSLKAYQNGIDATKDMHETLIKNNNPNSDEIKEKCNQIEEAWAALDKGVKERREKLNLAREEVKTHQDLCIQFARLASAFNTWYENVEENLTDPVRSRAVDEAENRLEEHAIYSTEIMGEQSKLDKLRELDNKIKNEAKIEKNPYTWFPIEELEDIWAETQRLVEERQTDLNNELDRQKSYDQKRKQFADFANKFADFITSVRLQLNGLNNGTLEDQLAEVVKQEKVIRNGKHDLNLVESLNKELEDVLVFDNIYTSHSALGLSQAWDGLLQMCSRMQISVKAQIEARSRTGIPEERLQEWKDGFSYFDKEQKGRLDYIEIKSLFRSLGIELALKEGDQESEEFVEILNTINPTIEGAVTKEEFVNYMINRETSQVKGKQDIFDAFQAISNPELPYVTKQELQSNLSPTQVEYCLRVMPKYEGPDAPLNLEAYDYRKFVKLHFN